MRFSLKNILKYLIPSLVVLYLISMIFNAINNGASSTIKSKDKTFLSPLIGFTLDETDLRNSEIRFYEASDGVGIATFKYNSILGFRVKILDKLKLDGNPGWKYTEIKDHKGNVTAFVYGYIKTQKESPMLKVKNEADMVDFIPFTSSKQEEMFWFFKLDHPSKNKDGFIIYDARTNKSIY